MKITVRGAWSAGDARRYRMLRANAIELNEEKGFAEESSLGFLSDLPGLRRLTILVTTPIDLSPVAQCADLEYLRLAIPGATQAISVGHLQHLREVSIETPRAITDLYDLDRLHTLWIGRYPEQSLVPLQKLSHLTSLALLEARKLTTLTGLAAFAGLRELELAGARKLTDVSALASVPNLEKLDVSNATSVVDWSPVGELTRLRWLGFEDVGTIAAVDFVGRLTALESLFIIGTARVGDGRVAQLGTHPSLRKVRLAQARIHDATADQIERQLRSSRRRSA